MYFVFLRQEVDFWYLGRNRRAGLFVVGLVFRRIIDPKKSNGVLETAEDLSLLTLGASLLVLTSPITRQGCTLIHYSNYVKFVIQKALQGFLVASQVSQQNQFIQIKHVELKSIFLSDFQSVKCMKVPFSRKHPPASFLSTTLFLHRVKVLNVVLMSTRSSNFSAEVSYLPRRC